MPRLLLVDDNPSIHKIAETLLAATDVQLISCGSGAEAMALVDHGDQFDVALLDTSMLGMDGWTLLQRLRETESTARMPVAMMAGVLDVVDPQRLQQAPIQGFLKKPVELRDLGDRVRRLMETPVPPPAPPPESAVTGAFLTRPALRVPEELKAHPATDDLLILGPEDLLQESPEAPAPEAEPLDLEGLDLEGLQNLTFPAGAIPPPEEPAPEPAAAAPEEPAAFSVPEFELADTLPELPLEPTQAFVDQLPDLGPALDHTIGEAPARPEAPSGLLDLGEPIDWSDDSDALVGIALGGPEPPPLLPGLPAAPPDLITLSDILDPPVSAPVLAPPEIPAPEPVPAEASVDPLAGLLADPVLMDRLAKALVARLGDQVLREIAWEVMPELAERMHPKDVP